MEILFAVVFVIFGSIITMMGGIAFELARAAGREYSTTEYDRSRRLSLLVIGIGVTLLGLGIAGLS